MFGWQKWVHCGAQEDPLAGLLAAIGQDVSLDINPVVGRRNLTGAMGTVFKSGVTPPAVTVSGTPASWVVGLKAQVTLTGTQTTMVFRWSGLDGAVGSWVESVPGAASVALIDPIRGDSGLTLACPAGTYTCDVFTPAVSNQFVSYPRATCNDSGPHARHVTIGASPPGYVTRKRSAKDAPALRFDSLADFIDSAVHASEAQPVTYLFIVDRYDNGDARYVFDQAGGGVDNAVATSSGKYFVAAGVGADTTYGTPLAGLPGSETWRGASLHVLAVEINGAASKLYVDSDTVFSTFNAGTNASTSIRIGARRTASGFWNGDVVRLIKFRRLLTAPELAVLMPAAVQQYLSGRIFCDGDSGTLGRTTVPAQEATYPNILQRDHATPLAVWNFGVGGQTLQTMRANAAARIDPHINPAAPFNIYVPQGGLNDCAAGRTAANIRDDMVAYVTDRLAAGATGLVVPTMHAIVLTAPQHVVRLAANDLLRNHAWPAGVVVADIGADARFIVSPGNVAAEFVGLPMYDNGGLTDSHLNGVGQAVVANEFIGPAITELIASA